MTFIRTIACCSAFLCSPVAYAAQVGAPAPAFSLPDLNGGTVTLEQHKGKVIFLDFWAPWCVPCRDELPELERLYRKYGNEGFIVIGISVDAQAKAAARFLRDTPVSFPVLMDAQGTVAEAYRLVNLPTGCLIGRNGVIRQCYRGFDKKHLQDYEKEIVDMIQQPKPDRGGSLP